MGERLTKHDVEKIEKEIEYRKLVVRIDKIAHLYDAGIWNYQTWHRIQI